MADIQEELLKFKAAFNCLITKLEFQLKIVVAGIRTYDTTLCIRIRACSITSTTCVHTRSAACMMFDEILGTDFDRSYDTRGDNHPSSSARTVTVLAQNRAGCDGVGANVWLLSPIHMMVKPTVAHTHDGET